MRFEYSAGVVAYAERGGKRYFLFLVKEDGRLDLPKGKIEKGERAEDAAIREAKEESGLDVALAPSFRHDIGYWYARGGEKVKKRVTMFLAKVSGSARVRSSWEHTGGYKWLEYGPAMEELSFKEWKRIIAKANAYIDRRERMDRLNEDYRRMPGKSKGWSLSRRFVPGEGPLDAEVMFVGQAPGAGEDRSGRPFVGMSGKLLDRLIAKAGLKRGSCYITSAVQFFPPKNRAPTYEEIRECRGFLMGQIDIVKPGIIVLLGSVAAKTVIDAGEIMRRHGATVRKDGRVYFLTLHPAAAVRLKRNMPIIEGDFAKLKGIVKDL
jgi:DNA polymerase